MFSCEFCEIFKSTYFYKKPLVAASVNRNFLMTNISMKLLISPITKQNKWKTVKKTYFEPNTWNGWAIMGQIFAEMKAYFKETSEEFSFLILQVMRTWNFKKFSKNNHSWKSIYFIKTFLLFIKMSTIYFSKVLAK